DAEPLAVASTRMSVACVSALCSALALTGQLSAHATNSAVKPRAIRDQVHLILRLRGERPGQPELAGPTAAAESLTNRDLKEQIPSCFRPRAARAHARASAAEPPSRVRATQPACTAPAGVPETGQSRRRRAESPRILQQVQ